MIFQPTLFLYTQNSEPNSWQMDWNGRNEQRRNARNHLYGIQKAMGLPESHEFGDVLDTIFRSLLENLSAIHSANIVHRDCESFESSTIITS